MIELLEEFQRALLSVDRQAIDRVVSKSGSDVTSIEFIESVIVPVLEEIGNGWENGRYALSQVYMSGRICEEIVNTILLPGGKERKKERRIAIALLEDYHALGKRIVYSMLRASGYDLLDYGRMGVDEIVRRVLNDRIQILLISVLMLPSALHVKGIRDKLDASGRKVRIVVGGAPFRFDRDLWREVGADDAGMTASDAIAIVDRMTEDIL